MAGVGGFSSVWVISLALLLLSTTGVNVSMADERKTWCVAKPSSDDVTLLDNIKYACSEVNCSVLNRGSSCFDPDTPINHASIAMNLYYQAKGRNYWNCDFNNSALIVLTDPSYGYCQY